MLGALPHSQKKAIEHAVGNKWVFTSAGATGVFSMSSRPRAARDRRRGAPWN